MTTISTLTSWRALVSLLPFDLGNKLVEFTFRSRFNQYYMSVPEFFEIYWDDSCIHTIFLKFCFSSKMEVSGNIPHFFPVYPHWVLGTRRLLVAFRFCSSFCLGQPGVNYVTARNIPSSPLFWSGVIREKLGKSPDSSQFALHSVGSVEATRKFSVSPLAFSCFRWYF